MLAPQGYGVCLYERPRPASRPSYWWQLLYDLFKWRPVDQPPFRRSIAFLTGVGRYSHISPQLDFVESDLSELRNFLLTDGGFDAVYEARDGNVTRELFDAYMRNYFSNPSGPAGPEDRLLVYYSGHGGAHQNVEPYLLFQEATPNDYSKNVLDVRDTFSWAKTIQAKHLLIILDSCYSGLSVDKPGPADAAIDLANALAEKPSGLLLTAGTGDEKAYAVKYSKERSGSIFTHALMDALRSMSQSEGIVTIGEAFERAKLTVSKFDAVENKKMTPMPTTLVRKNGVGEGSFIFINPRAKNPQLPSGLYGQGSAIAKAPDSVDPGLQLIQIEYEEVKNSDDLPSLKAFVDTYKGKPYGQSLVGLIEVRISNVKPPAPQPGDEFRNPRDGLTYVWIPPGKFMMGCSPGDECINEDQTQHEQVILTGFWIGQTPVTQAAYEKLVGNNPSYFKGSNLPVENISWNAAESYCKAAGMRLPTEAQWEYAARAGTTGSRYGNLDEIAWYGGNSENQTHPVGKKAPNAWKLFDMLGNVWQWTADGSGNRRVLRGGCWLYSAKDVRVSSRIAGETGTYVTGVRCVGQ